MPISNQTFFVPGLIIRRPELDDLAGVDPASPEFRQRFRDHVMMGKELEDLQEVARAATRAALEAYEPIPEEWNQDLTLGTFVDGEDRIFELYVARERTRDAIVLTSARVDRATKAVTVVVTNLRQRRP